MTTNEAIQAVKEVTGMSLPWNDRHYEALQMALSALEKQIPKKPMKIIDPYITELYQLKCPICGNYIAHGNSEIGRLNKWTLNSNICSYCGQAIDFSEWEGEG